MIAQILSLGNNEKRPIEMPLALLVWFVGGTMMHPVMGICPSQNRNFEV